MGTHCVREYGEIYRQFACTVGAIYYTVLSNNRHLDHVPGYRGPRLSTNPFSIPGIGVHGTDKVVCIHMYVKNYSSELIYKYFVQNGPRRVDAIICW